MKLVFEGRYAAPPRADSSSLPVRYAIKKRHPLHMETAAKYGLKDLFFEAVAIEWRIARALGQAVAGAAVFVVVQLVNVVTYPAALVIDLLGLFLGFEIATVIGIRTTDD